MSTFLGKQETLVVVRVPTLVEHLWVIWLSTIYPSLIVFIVTFPLFVLRASFDQFLVGALWYLGYRQPIGGTTVIFGGEPG